MAKKEASTGLMKLLEHQLQDLYYVEKQLTKALPRMAKKATNEELSSCFQDHLTETQGQVARLEEIFSILGKSAKAQKCPAIDGILEEAKEIMEEFADDVALDAGIVSAAQKVEHYEITSYGSMKAWAEQLGLDDVVALIDETLEEEKAADGKLTQIAQEVVNAEADEEESEDDEDGATVSAKKRAPAKTPEAKKSTSRSGR